MTPATRFATGFILTVLGAAAIPAQAQGKEVAACRLFFSQWAAETARAGVGDRQAAVLNDFPYLRINRLLADLGRRPLTQPAETAWLDHMQALAGEGFEVELANLPEAPRGRLARSVPPGMAPNNPLAAVSQCSERLRRQDFPAGRSVQAMARLRRQAIVPADYVAWQRAVGLYGLLILPVAYGIHDWHQDTRATFATTLTDLPVAGRLVSYGPPPAAAVAPNNLAPLLQRAADNPLHIPSPTAAERAGLFERFAPVWEIDVASDDDRLGAPYWPAGAKTPAVDTARPVIYRLLSHTRVNDQILLQLNYIAWFPARPRTSSLDLLGGNLDGITWRVTLSPQGEPIMYDTMHNCGCYHMFFPAAASRPKPFPDNLREIPLIPQQAPALNPGERIVLRIAHRTHYIERVSVRAASAETTMIFDWSDYTTLRSLPLAGGGRRSLFRPDSIVPGSQRRERYVFWPMGVPVPGAMRQWGHHATAFIGRRHFDDADLLARYFTFDGTPP